jgi:hypothetical protein
MSSEMSSKERMLAAVRGQEVDHIPLGQLFHSTIMETPPEKQWRDQFERARVMKDLGLDPTIDMMDNYFTRRFHAPLVRGPEDLDAFEHLLQPPQGGYRDLWLSNVFGD